MPTPAAPLFHAFGRQRNPTNDKVSARAAYAGASAESVILQEFAGRVIVDVAPGEVLQAIEVVPSEDETAGVGLSWEYLPGLTPDGGLRAWAFLRFGVDLPAATTSRCYVRVTTDRGVSTRQIWIGLGGGLYLSPTGRKPYDCTTACVHVYCDTAILDDRSLDVTFALNVIPYQNDEFFRGGEYSANRYCNTIRNHGGAITGTVWVDAEEVIPETDLLDIHGLYLVEPLPGYHQITVRLRPEWGSRFHKDLVGTFRVVHVPTDALMP